MTTDIIERIPPHSVEAEQAVLAAMLVSAKAIDAVLECELAGGHFYRRAHGTIYQAMLKIHERQEPVDLITLRDELGAEEKLDEVGGYGYLVDLAGSIPTAEHARYYARIVREKGMARSMIRNHSEAIAALFADEDDPQAVADAFEARQAGLNLKTGSDTAADTHALIDAFYTDLYARRDAAKNGGSHLLDFGFYDLDQALGGVQPGDLVIIGARPSMGKTAFSLNLFWNVAAYGRPHFYTLEMPKERIMNRLVSMLSGVDGKRIRRGDLDEREMERVGVAIATIAERDFVIDDAPGLNFERLRRAVLKDVARGKKPSLIAIDYLQLMEVDPRQENRNLALGKLSRQLKNLAREVGCVIIALSQLSRGVESRTDKHPMLSDLRESGAIEQDADIVMFLYRDEYYNPDTEKKGVTEVNVAKHRDGQVGSVELSFDKNAQRFVDRTYATPEWVDAGGAQDDGGGYYAPIL